MQKSTLWKYCTTEQCVDMLLSFKLLGDDWPDKKVIACLYALSNHAEKHYSEVYIPKRDGSKRRLLVPDPLLKEIQRNILQHILYGMEISPYATAYHPGGNILNNAVPHVGKSKVLKLDMKDFFGNILFFMVLRSAFSVRYFPPSVGVLLTYLCCYEDCLPQGSPTSAAISNLVMRPFDDYMGNWCAQRHIFYTRYCDDMTFSGDFDEKEVRRKVAGYLRAMGFCLNEKKTRTLTVAQRQSVTGIVVNEKPQVSKEYRKKLRQQIYYCTRFGVASHLAQTGSGEYLSLEGRGEEKYLVSLLGRVNFVLQINPKDRQFAEEKRRVMAMLKKFRTEK